MDIRPYRSADLPEMCKLFYDTVHLVNIRDYTQAQVDAWATGTVNSKAWDKSLSEHNTLIATENGKIVGFGDIDHTGYLDRLYVHHAHQRQGIATALCNRLETSVAADVLTVHASITAKPFFEKRGYRVEREQTVVRAGISLTNYVMAKQRGFTIRRTGPGEFAALVDIWERSVRATLHFLSEDDLAAIKNAMPTLYLPAVDVYVAITKGRIAGFVGLSDDTIEMLFVDADLIGKGYGTALVDFALERGMTKVDVNEQNTSALGFYLSKGFEVTGRDATDADGHPYPILHLGRLV